MTFASLGLPGASRIRAGVEWVRPLVPGVGNRRCIAAAERRADVMGVGRWHERPREPANAEEDEFAVPVVGEVDFDARGVRPGSLAVGRDRSIDLAMRGCDARGGRLRELRNLPRGQKSVEQSAAVACASATQSVAKDAAMAPTWWPILIDVLPLSERSRLARRLEPLRRESTCRRKSQSRRTGWKRCGSRTGRIAPMAAFLRSRR